MTFVQQKETDGGGEREKEEGAAAARRKGNLRFCCPLLLLLFFLSCFSCFAVDGGGRFNGACRSTNSKLVSQKVKGQTVQGQMAQEFWLSQLILNAYLPVAADAAGR